MTDAADKEHPEGAAGPDGTSLRLAVFGATSATGKALVVQSLAKGHHVTAFVRRPAFGDHSHLEQVVGDLSDLDAVSKAVSGSDAVIVLFGSRPPYDDVFCEQGTKDIIAAMQAADVRRLICQTGGMIGAYRPNRTLPFELLTRFFCRRAPQAEEDRTRQESAVSQSPLDWTIIKPPRLTDGPAIGRVAVGESVRLGLSSVVSRTDLASFILEEISRPHHIGERVFIRT